MNPAPGPQLLPVLRGAWGAVLVIWPERVVRGASGRAATDASRIVVRVLGLRQLAQACVGLRWSSRATRELGMVVDALHASTGLIFGLLPTTWRRAALLDCSVAAAFAAFGAAAVEPPDRKGRSPDGPERHQGHLSGSRGE